MQGETCDPTEQKVKSLAAEAGDLWSPTVGGQTPVPVGAEPLTRLRRCVSSLPCEMLTLVLVFCLPYIFSTGVQVPFPSPGVHGDNVEGSLKVPGRQRGPICL